jgi:hypothetical protein
MKSGLHDRDRRDPGVRAGSNPFEQTHSVAAAVDSTFDAR